MRIRAKLGGTEVALAPEPTFATPAAGTAQRLDFTTGEDADGDGLPDAWERLMMSYNEKAGQPGQPSTIAEFRSNDDCAATGFAPVPPELEAVYRRVSADWRRVGNLVADGRLTREAADGRRSRIRSAFAAACREKGVSPMRQGLLLRRLDGFGH